jgi:hypothetical protein
MNKPTLPIQVGKNSRKRMTVGGSSRSNTRGTEVANRTVLEEEVGSIAPNPDSPLVVKLAFLIHKPYDAVRFAGRFLRPLSRDMTRPRMVWK